MKMNEFKTDGRLLPRSSFKAFKEEGENNKISNSGLGKTERGLRDEDAHAKKRPIMDLKEKVDDQLKNKIHELSNITV